VNYFRHGDPPRPLNPADDPALPLHVQAPGARVRKSGETLVVETEEGETKIPMINVSELALYGPVSVTTPALHELMRREVPVSWHSTGGWLMGHTIGARPKSAETRAAQFRASADPLACGRLAAGVVAAKIRNQRTMLRRNWKGPEATQDAPEKEAALDRLKRLAEKAEGEAAAIYFGLFDRLIAREKALPFAFKTRNRRPPTDPVNAMLSFAYALCARALTGMLIAAALDPYQGFYHRPRHGRPALALDMMEPFRPLLCDSTVLMAVNNGEVRASDFHWNGSACAMKPSGRRALIAAWKRRLSQETTHPVFGYRVETRRLMAVQCRLLARHLAGEIGDMPHYVPR
jgi:CRISPR-associated endonuclease Cas1